MTLDLTSLEKAIAQLEQALEYCACEAARKDPALALHLRAGAIQAFEFTYELSFKMLKRWLEATEPNPEAVDHMTFGEIIRRGYEIGLLDLEMADWKTFRKDRGTTSHTYDTDKAENVFRSIPKFLAEAKYLYAEMKKRQGTTT